MGLFGGGNSRSETYNEETNFTNVDNRLAEGDGAIFGGNNTLNADGNIDNVSITTTDFGALDKAEKIAKSGLSAASSIADGALSIAAKAAEDDSSETLKFLVIGLSVVGVALAVFTFRK